jgi:hypothetical protein
MENNSDTNINFDEMLREHQASETKGRPDAVLNAVCFLAPLIVSPFVSRVSILLLIPVSCLFVGLVLALLPTPPKIRQASLSAFLGGLASWIFCSKMFFGFQI